MGRICGRKKELLTRSAEKQQGNDQFQKKQTSDKDYGICIFSDISGSSNNIENANTEHRFN